jgi:hypothetical protein
VLAYAAVREPQIAALTGGIGAIGAVLLAFALVRRTNGVLPWAVVLLGIAYTVSLVLHGSGVDGGAPLVAVGLLLCAELGTWSIDEQFSIPAERAVLLARASALTALVLGSLVVATTVVALSLVPASGLVWTVLGAASAVGVVGLAVRLARPQS